MQSAYRSNHSTETAPVYVFDTILKALDGGKATFLTLLDLSAAFDTVNHDILIQRLERTCNVKGNALE